MPNRWNLELGSLEPASSAKGTHHTAGVIGGPKRCLESDDSDCNRRPALYEGACPFETNLSSKSMDSAQDPRFRAAEIEGG